MTKQEREVLQRVTGVLEGLTVSGDISDAVSEILVIAVERLDSILDADCEARAKYDEQR